MASEEYFKHPFEVDARGMVDNEILILGEGAPIRLVKAWNL